MITVYGEGRGIRVIWLLEEMGLQYSLRPVDMMAGVENDPEFLEINPGGFIPAIRDGDTVMVESIAIMEYLMARYGPTPLAPSPDSPAFASYQQFLHLGEAGLATPLVMSFVSQHFAPEEHRGNWGGKLALEIFEKRLRLVSRQLETAPYMAGEQFTAADISVSYALMFAHRMKSFELGRAELAYLRRTTTREAYLRALEVSPALKASHVPVAEDA